MPINDSNTPALGFAESVANCAHDIKNSAGVLMSAAESIAAALPDPSVRAQLHVLQTEARRINHDLIHLLGMYKLERAQQAINPTIVDCEDLLDELRAYNKVLFAGRGLRFESTLNEAAEGYFDRELVTGILNSAINNAQRYAQDRVKVSCGIDDGYTIFSVADDGAGFPTEILQSDLSDTAATNYATGSTGLGLYFAQRIAELHCHRDRRGRVSLANDGIDGGACFRLCLP